MLCDPHPDEAQVGDKECKHHRAFPAVDAAVSENEETHDHSGRDEDWDVPQDHVDGHGRGPDGKGRPDHEAEVEDVGAENIAYADLALAFEDRGHRRGKLGQGGSESNHRKTDQGLGDAKARGQLDAANDQHFGAPDEHRNADHRHDQLPDRRAGDDHQFRARAPGFGHG